MRAHRVQAILIIAESSSTNCITRWPRDVADREPPAPSPLRTLFPPDASFTDGYLTIEQDFAITNEMQNMLVDAANRKLKIQLADHMAVSSPFDLRLILGTEELNDTTISHSVLLRHEKHCNDRGLPCPLGGWAPPPC